MPTLPGFECGTWTDPSLSQQQPPSVPHFLTAFLVIFRQYLKYTSAPLRLIFASALNTFPSLLKSLDPSHSFFFIYLFIFGCIGSLFWCAGFSSRWLLLLQSTGCRHVGLRSCGSRAPEFRLGSCGTHAQLLCVMWDPPGPGLEPVSPALAGRFSNTAPPGNPILLILHE